MRKILTYLCLAISTILVIMVFLTAKTYTQLAIATALYPLIAYFAYSLFSRPQMKVQVQNQTAPNQQTPVVEAATTPTANTEIRSVNVVDVVDIDKRAFLKFIGATGLSFFIFSLFGRKIESLLFNQTSPNLGGGAGNASGFQGQVTDRYRIAEIDDNEVAYYGFTAQDGSWFIMKEDPEDGSFRYIKGDSDFPKNWNNRKNLSYDYFHKVF